MKAPTILIIDDDIDLFTIYKKAISPIVNIKFVSNLKEGFKFMTTEEFDLILLDIYLDQDISLELLEYYSKDDNILLDKIILITGEGKVDDEIRGYQLGVRDYIKKPINLKLFGVIIEKHLQQVLNKEESKIVKGPFCMDLYKQEISIITDEKYVVLDLTLKEFKLLKLLLSFEGRIVGREQIIEVCWDKEVKNTSRAQGHIFEF